MPGIQTRRQYPVMPSNQRVVLTVTIGEGNLGTAAIVLNGVEVARRDQQVTADLGPAASLQGAVVKVFSRINQTSSNPRWSVTYDWSGGRGPQTDFDEGVFATPDESVPVKATYDLT